MIFTSFDEAEAIAFGKRYFADNEMDAILSWDNFSVFVYNAAIGQCREELAWSSYRDLGLEYLSKASLAKLTAAKEEYHLLWDTDVLLEDVQNAIRYEGLSEYHHFTVSKGVIESQLLSRKAQAANDLEQYLFDK